MQGRAVRARGAARGRATHSVHERYLMCLANPKSVSLSDLSHQGAGPRESRRSRESVPVRGSSPHIAAPVLRDEDVLELQVAVHDAERVQVLDRQQHLRMVSGGGGALRAAVGGCRGGRARRSRGPGQGFQSACASLRRGHAAKVQRGVGAARAAGVGRRGRGERGACVPARRRRACRRRQTSSSCTAGRRGRRPGRTP